MRGEALAAHPRADGTADPRQTAVSGTGGSPGPSGGHDALADPDGALYWPEERLLIVADLHLEKGSAFAKRGVLLPPYDTASTLGRLARLVEHYAPRVRDCAGRQLPRRSRAAAHERPRSHHARACNAAAIGSGSPAITIRIWPKDIGGRFAGDARDRRADLSP